MTPVFLNPSSSSSSTTSFCHDLEVHDFQDDQQHLKLFLSPYNVEEGRSSSSLAPSPTNYYSYEYSRIVNPDQTSDVVVQSHQHHDGQKAKIDFGKSRRNKLVVYRNFENTTSREAQDEDQNSEIFGKNVNNNITNSSDGSVKYWMSSKMRLIQKMSNLPDQPEWPATTTFSGTTSTASAHIINDSDHHHGQRAHEKSELLPLHSPNKDNKAQLTFNSYNTTASGAVIRVCSDCNTTTTPLWRSGPRGPKSLCNACGIRQRKARRAMAAAAAATATATAAAADSADTNLPIKISHNYKAHNNNNNNNNNVMIKEKKFRGNNSIGHYKGKFKLKVVNTANSASSVGKRERINSNDDNKLCFGDFASFGLNENNCSAFQGVQFPRDVAEAAILLMELSNCHGFVHS